MRTSPSIWLIMLALLGTHMAGMGAFLTVPVLAPAIAAETGLSASLAGIHTALVYAGALFSGPITQGLLQRHGGIRVCQGALVVVGAGIALAAIGHPIALLFSALLAGLGHGPITPAGSHLLAPRTPARIRSLVFGLKQCGVPAGAMMVAAVAPILAISHGWRAAVLAMAGFSLLLALALQPLRAVLDADRAGPGGAPLRPWQDAKSSLSILRDDTRIRALTFAASSFGIAQFCFGSFFVVWQVQVMGAGLEQAGLMLALAQGSGVAGRIAWALIADRIGALPVLLALGVAIGGACGLLALAGPGWPSLIIAVVAVAMGASAVGWNGVMLSEVARVAPPGRVGAATAALGFVFAGVMIVAPTLFSALVLGTGGFSLGFALCGLAGLAGAVALARLRFARPAP
ncbi:MFS transporter [Sediminicoccus sp. BL-A-41-H5]|uniref:MFS transporter n=1 Tax=Sediminicoccus sp. BL-A-41-H5 TaxID=3421106 RepID=UPI003D66BA1E